MAKMQISDFLIQTAPKIKGYYQENVDLLENWKFRDEQSQFRK
jgi:hypothetical protein